MKQFDVAKQFAGFFLAYGVAVAIAIILIGALSLYVIAILQGW